MFGLSAALLRGALGYWSAVAVGSVAQVAVHIGYAALPAAEPHAGHGAHAAVDVSAAEPSGGMVLAHAVSALVVAAVWSLRTRALDAAVGWLRAEAAELPCTTPRLERTVARPRSFVVELAAPTRGPPIALARP